MLFRTPAFAGVTVRAIRGDSKSVTAIAKTGQIAYPIFIEVRELGTTGLRGVFEINPTA